MRAQSADYGSLGDDQPPATRTGGTPSRAAEREALRDISGWWQAFANARAADESHRQLDADGRDGDPRRHGPSAREARDDGESADARLWCVDHLERFAEVAIPCFEWPRLPVFALLALIGCVRARRRVLFELARARALARALFA